MASGGLQAASRATDLEISVGGPPLGPLLGSSWGTVGLSGEPPGPALFGASWPVLERSEGPPSEAVRERWEAGKARTPKSKTLGKRVNLAFQGPLGGPLESVLERVGVLVGRLEGSLGVFGASWDRLGPSRDLY